MTAGDAAKLTGDSSESSGEFADVPDGEKTDVEVYMLKVVHAGFGLIDVRGSFEAFSNIIIGPLSVSPSDVIEDNDSDEGQELSRIEPASFSLGKDDISSPEITDKGVNDEERDKNCSCSCCPWSCCKSCLLQ